MFVRQGTSIIRNKRIQQFLSAGLGAMGFGVDLPGMAMSSSMEPEASLVATVRGVDVLGSFVIV